jgi:hypothetical protein
VRLLRKNLRQKPKKKRIYEDTHKDLFIIGYFDYMIYTDKVYVNLLSIIQKEILKEGYQYDTENI